MATSLTQYFPLIVYTGFILWILRNVFYWVGLWQDKEYRIDRLLVHIRETIQGRKILFSVGNYIKWLLFFVYPVIAYYDYYAPWYEIIIGTFFIIQALNVLQNILYHRIKRPILTGKSIIIILLSLLLIGLLLIFPLMNTFFWLLFIDRLIPLIVLLFVFFMAFPTEVCEDIKIAKAKKKMQQLPHIFVIAVSGSYGKTSTKEFIAQVLSKKFSVVKTPGSNNTPVGIANTVLMKVKTDTKIFVVEMGAYKIGELAELTRIVRPSVSVTTAISDQHISLYKNLDNVVESEYEIIQSLPKDGFALFNGNSKEIKKLYNRTKVKKIWYTVVAQKQKSPEEIIAYRVHATTDGVSFLVNIHGKEITLKTKLYGEHVVENILPAVYFADYLGFSSLDIAHAIAELKPPAQTMIKKVLTTDAIAMDDTFNVSPESVFSAMDFLKLAPKKKLFVLSPLTELGSEARTRHYQIGQKASNICDFLFLLNANFVDEIIQGVLEGKGTCHVQVGRPEEIAKIIRKLTKKGDMIIFEGKESKMVLNKII